jgi:hypothetical protein
MKRGFAVLAAAGFAFAAGAADGDPVTGSAADFAAKGASAEEQLKQRLLARVRTIPGTDTQFLVGGYLQIDAIATRKGQEGEEQNTFFASAIPFGPASDDYRLSARQSQFNWVSRTPVGAGHFWTRLEANLFPYDGTTSPTLNQLYVRWEDYVLLGKTYSTFMDDSALPSTLDYNGPGGVIYVRQAQARASLKLGENWTVAGSVEDPQADLTAGGALLGVTTSADQPDLAARVRYEGEGGHFQLAGLWRRNTVTAVGPLGTTERRVDGSGVSASGSISLFEDDSVLFQAATGKGIGRYFNDPLSAVGLSLGAGAGNRLELLRMSGATLYYERKWSPEWATVAGASTLWVSDDTLRSPEALRRTIYASLNLIRRFTPTVAAGAEVIWGEARRVDGASSSNTRLQLSLRVLVF